MSIAFVHGRVTRPFAGFVWFCLMASAAAQTASDAEKQIPTTLPLEKMAVSWTPAGLRLAAVLPERLEDNLVLCVSAVDGAGEEVKVEIQDGNSLTVTGPVEAICKALAPGTRSLLFGRSPDRAEYQIDLPPVRIQSLRQVASPNGGISVRVSVEHLLPGFKPFARIEAQREEHKKPPRLSKPTLDENGLHILMLSLPELSDAQAEAAYYLALQNPDGSRTRTLALRRQGNRLLSPVEKVEEARERPVYQVSQAARPSQGAEAPGENDPQPVGETAVSEDPDPMATKPPEVAANEKTDGREEPLPAQVDVDWKSGNITLQVETPPTVATNIQYEVVAGQPANNKSMLEVKAGGGRLVVQGPGDSLVAALVLATRSLRLRNATDPEATGYRVDLPGLELAGAAVKPGEGSAGPVLTLKCRGLLPGYRVALATQPLDDGESIRSRERFLPQVGINLPRVADTSSGEDHDAIKIQFAPRHASAGAVRFYLTVVNSDRSRAATLGVTQSGNQFQDAKQSSPARPAPIDVETTAPDVEYLSLAEAQEEARRAGLYPVAMDVATLQEIEGDEEVAKEEIVLRQGIVPGQPARRGQVLLLGIRTGLGAEDFGSSDSNSAPGNVADAPLDVGDSFGFASLDETANDLESGVGANDSDPLGSFDAVSDDGGANGFDEPPQDDLTSGEGETPDENSAESAGGVLPVDADPGVCLNPDLTGEKCALAGLMKVVTEAVLSQLASGRPPGTIGQAVTEAIRQHEEAIEKALTDGKLDTLPLAQILDRTATILQISLVEGQREETLAQWREFIAGRASPELLDMNQNGVVCDDLMVWLLERLTEGGQLNPACHAQLVVGDMGTTLAALPSKPMSPAWTEEGGLQSTANGLKPGTGSPQGPAGEKKTAGAPTAEVEIQEDEIRIPKGKPRVKEESTPDRVLIPLGLIGQPLSEAAQHLAKLGLKINQTGKLFKDDKVASLQPSEGEWVPPEKELTLVVSRRVPDFVTKTTTSGAAREELQKREFTGEVAKSLAYRTTDLVVSQTPPPESYEPVGSKVTLTIQRPVPKVEGLRAGDAAKLIENEGFRAAGPQDAIASDVVVQQAPHFLSGQKRNLADPGSTIELVKVETYVPDLEGTSLKDAKTLAAAEAALRERQLRSELLGPKTGFKGAKVIDQDPEFGARIDRQQDRVGLRLVVPVPDLSQTVTIPRAKELLAVVDLKGEPNLSEYRADDLVLSANVVGDRFSDGARTYTLPETAVQLGVGRLVPAIAKQPWSQGLDALRGKGFQVQSPSGESPGSHVWTTSPSGGLAVDPRRTVTVYPGQQVRSVVGQSYNAAAALIQGDGLSAAVAGRTTQETEDAALFSRTMVRGQSPSAGEIVRKSRNSVVGLSVVDYIERLYTVPQLVGLSTEAAEQKARANNMTTRDASTDIPDVTTRNRNDDGVKFVRDQNPRPSSRRRRGAIINVYLARYKYEPEFRGFTAYIWAGARGQIGAYWKLEAKPGAGGLDLYAMERDRLDADFRFKFSKPFLKVNGDYAYFGQENDYYRLPLRGVGQAYKSFNNEPEKDHWVPGQTFELHDDMPKSK